MTDPTTLYRQLIIENSKCTTHVGPLPSATGSATLHNPLCGDTVTLHVQVDESGVVLAARFEAFGCAIAKAVASLMIEHVTGQPIERVKSWIERSHAAVQGDDQLGFAELTGMAHLPARQRCATLPWDALAAALDEGAGHDA